MADNETNEIMLLVIGGILFAVFLGILAFNYPTLIKLMHQFTGTHNGNF